jgi:DNA replication protein DnaD
MNDSSPSTSSVFAKWGEAANAGFQSIPDVLLKNQSKLNLSATDMLVLLNITMHWWYPKQRPFPRSTTIAGRMKVEARTVQRALATLKERGLLVKVRETSRDGVERVVCDLSGLVKRLAMLAKKDENYIARTKQREARHAQ